MNILSIGNSFSHDAHKWLHKLAKVNGVDLETVNLFVSGCSLETHWTNVLNNNASYDLEINGNVGERKISIEDALKMDDWDVVTVQQVSQFSGMPETYEPYLSNLVNVIKNIQPNAKLYFHQTWAYETDCKRSRFANYDNNQRRMYDRIVNTTENAARSINAEIIPVGRVIQYLRDNVAEFDYKNGGISLCRDGLHLSCDYGRYAAAATWFRAITGSDVSVTGFETFDPVLLKKIIAVVNKLSHARAHTDFL